MSSKQRECFPLATPSGFVNEGSQQVELPCDLFQSEQVHAGGEDGSFHHGMSIEKP